MWVNLEKEDLINLIISKSPNYDDIYTFAYKGLGRYYGGFNDKWEWNRSALEKLSEEDLLDLYSYLQGELYEFLKEE